MRVSDSSLAAVLARARNERRRRLAGSLDAVALTRSNTTSSSRGIAEQAQRRSAELDPPSSAPPSSAPPSSAPPSSVPPAEPGWNGDEEDGQDRSWLR